ncbi:MAG: hypothetical protein SWJ54_15945 [Cyanobacteriota bacterium]|nr:hypothetical protein [Cyanobacteriota bacterium]
MVVVIVCINVLISIVCLDVARRVWKLRRSLARLERVCIRLEHRMDTLLCKTRNVVERGGSGSYRLKQGYSTLQDKLQQFERAIAILRLTQLILLRKRY